MTRIEGTEPSHRGWTWLLAVGLLAGGVLWIYWRLVLTNRVMATGDVFTYFTPYRDYANAALRDGRLPLWNPYLFLGVPFLANPQAAVLYPLHWPFIWLDTAKSLVASMTLHLWLAGIGAWLYARRVARLTWLPALGTGLVFSLSGYLGARVGQINQLSAAAWLPWLLWALEETDSAVCTRRPRSLAWVVVLSGIVALQLLAGHTQTSFINMVGLGVAAVWPGVAAVVSGLVAAMRRARTPFDRAALRAAGRRLALVAAAAGLAVLLAAPQLLPTWELSQQSIRAEGLTYREAVSFSLRPTHLLLTLLPAYSENLADRFGTPAYAEFVASVGITSLVLAAFGILSARRQRSSGVLASPTGLASGLTAAGFTLALGLYNPLTFVLYSVVPGFDLFRAPARWMLLVVFGISVLAGYGLQATPFRLRRLAGEASQRPRVRLSRLAMLLLAGLAILLLALSLLQQWPGLLTLSIWLLTGLAAVALAIGERGAAWRRTLLVGLLVAELTGASLALDHTRPTAVEAIGSLRTAPAHLVAVARQEQAAGQIPGRFLSLSGITYDPGDLADIRQMLELQLPAQAVYDFIVASKLQEIVAPNLPLLWRLPAVDGYDGGVLPLRRYVDLQTLFLPADQLSPDGRLREQLAAVPSGRLLRLLGVEHVITDKTFDVWHDGVYYDLELSNRLEPGQAVTIARADRLEATAVGLFSHLDGAASLPAGSPVAEVQIETHGQRETWTLVAGTDTAEGQWTEEASHPQPAVKQPWPREQAGWDYLARRTLSTPVVPERLTVRNVAPTGTLVLRGASLIDDRTATHAALTLPAGGHFQRVHSGDVKIYRSLNAQPRAHLVGQAALAPDDMAALALLSDATFEPAAGVVLLEPEVVAAGLSETLRAIRLDASTGRVTDVRYEPERVVMQVELPAPGVLVLSDSWYPGWTVTVDGQAAALLRANLLFRAVVLPAGEHTVVFEYESASLTRGVAAALTGGVVVAVLLVAALVLAGASRRRREP